MRTNSVTKEPKYYILRTERPGKIVPTGTFQSGLKMLSEKLVKSEYCFSAKKGDIFTELPIANQPGDEYKIGVVSVEDNRKVLEVQTEDLAEISNDVAELLMAVGTPEKRYELYSKRRFTEQALAARVGDMIVMEHDGSKRNGVIKGIGSIEGRPGRFFRVELQLHEQSYYHGTTITRSSHVDKTATADQLTFKPSGKKISDSKTSNSYASGQIEEHDKFGNFEMGMKVVVFRDEKPLKGTIKFIGKADFQEDMSYGIELDTPDGNSDGLLAGKRVMRCKRNYGIFVKGEELMDSNFLKDDDSADKTRKPKDEVDDYRRVTRSRSNSYSLRLQNDARPSVKSVANLRNDKTTSQEDIRKKNDELEMDVINENTTFHNSSDFRHKTSDLYISMNGQIAAMNLSSQKNSGPASLPFDDRHFALENKRNTSSTDYLPNKAQLPRRPSENSLEILSTTEISHKVKRSKPDIYYDHSLQVDSVVQVSINGAPKYGLIKWLGKVPEVSPDELLAGLELEEPSPGFGDGTLKGKRYFTCLAGRGFFVKLSSCKKDERFISSAAPSTLPVNQSVEEVKGNYLPPSSFKDVKSGKMQGIQGHHNSCYLDSTLFAMFAFSMAFDSVLYRKKRDDDITEYEQVRNALKDAIVNPLRVKGFVNAASVLRLRGWLDKLANVPGFMNEEKDPEEFLMLLLKDVLKVDPFLKIRTNQDILDESYFYQILVDREEFNPLPTLQYLFELSFLTGSFCLEEVPSVLVIQLPRSGLQKMYKRIRINQTLDVSRVMSYASTSCFICEREAEFSCKDCRYSFDWEHPFVDFCAKCSELTHMHSNRTTHQVKRLDRRVQANEVKECKEMKQLELFAVVCIETSHYVTFAKCGAAPDDKWVFFDSMADRVGEESGHNVPEIVECPEIKEWFNKTPLTFAESDSKNTPEKVVRLFEDASLCFYRSNELSMYR